MDPIVLLAAAAVVIIAILAVSISRRNRNATRPAASDWNMPHASLLSMVFGLAAGLGFFRSQSEQGEVGQVAAPNLHDVEGGLTHRGGGGAADDSTTNLENNGVGIAGSTDYSGGDVGGGGSY